MGSVVVDRQQFTAELESALGVRSLAPLIQGGQKVVFTAEMSGQDVVVKVVFVPPGPQGDLVRARAHNREVELLAAVDSPHVVKVLTDAVELGPPLDAVTWVEQRLDGEDLGHLLGRAWSEGEVRSLITDLGKGTAACHDLEVVHRDLSPGNVRRTSAGLFVLMDPGLARHLEKTAITGHYQPGTDGFRSPEHVPGGECVPASDTFALGILACCAVTTQLPVEEVDEHSHLLVVCNGYHAAREVTTAAGTVPVRQPRVNDRRVDAASCERARFASAILPAW